MAWGLRKQEEGTRVLEEAGGEAWKEHRLWGGETHVTISSRPSARRDFGQVH